tara:strand:+ start:416 stop:568 length:153 start_codon:yes stop_codon:yes gene_type:complete
LWELSRVATAQSGFFRLWHTKKEKSGRQTEIWQKGHGMPSFIAGDAMDAL